VIFSAYLAEEQCSLLCSRHWRPRFRDALRRKVTNMVTATVVRVTITLPMAVAMGATITHNRRARFLRLLRPTALA
jgi:cell division protein FtsX